MTTTTEINMAASTTIVVQVLQTSGGSLNVGNVSLHYLPRFTLYKIF